MQNGSGLGSTRSYKKQCSVCYWFSGAEWLKLKVQYVARRLETELVVWSVVHGGGDGQLQG